MKYFLFLALSFIACNTAPTGQAKLAATLTDNLSFTQIADDYVRPAAGVEYWNGAYQVNMPASVDYYYRFKWTDIQDYSSGKYVWMVFDQQIHTAIDRGCKFNFRIMGHYPGQGAKVDGSYLGYPLAVHNAMQAEPIYKDWKDTGSDFPGYNSWTPNWNAPSFRAAYNAMMDAVIAHLKSSTYKGWNLYDVVGRVDIGTFGVTGEWTGYNLGTKPRSAPTTVVATPQTQIQFIDDMVSRFPDKQLVICSGAVNGTAVSDSIAPAVGYHVLTTSNQVGRIGLRSDNLGETDSWIHPMREQNNTVYNGLKFSDAIMNSYKVAPWVGEPYSCCTINGGSVQYWDLVRQIGFYHISSFGNGNLENSGNSTVQATVKAASKAAGFRLTLTGGNLAGNTILLNWQNNGVAPIYENWDVTFELRSGSKVVWAKKSGFNPRLFMGSASALDTLPAGSGDLYLVIRDPSGYRKPLPLAITGQNSDGSYLIKAGATIAGTVTQPPADTVPAIPPVDIPPIKADTVIIYDTIPRVCPACPVCPVIDTAAILKLHPCPPLPKQRTVVSITITAEKRVITYDDGSTTDL